MADRFGQLEVFEQAEIRGLQHASHCLCVHGGLSEPNVDAPVARPRLPPTRSPCSLVLVGASAAEDPRLPPTRSPCSLALAGASAAEDAVTL